MRVLQGILIVMLAMLSGCIHTMFEEDSVRDRAEDVELFDQHLSHVYLQNHAEQAQRLLAPSPFDRMRIEVRHVQGCAPSRYALQHLEGIARRHCEKPGGIRINAGEPIAPAGGPQPLSEAECQRLGESHLGPPAGVGEIVVYVLYIPELRDEQHVLARAGGALPKERGIPNILICTRTVERRAFLHVTRDEVEAGVLIHEFGHLLGLCHNPAHTIWNKPPHCTHPECAMTGVAMGRAILGTLFYDPFRVILGSLPKDYCRECRRDLDAYREFTGN